VGRATDDGVALVDRLAGLPEEERTATLSALVRAQVAGVLGRLPQEPRRAA